MKNMKLNNNGDTFDFENFGNKPKTKTNLEILYDDLKNQNPSIINDITKVSKILLENKKDAMKNINKNMNENLNYLNEKLISYNDTIIDIKINNKNINRVQIQQLKTVFSKLYLLIETEKYKLLILKSLKMIENNGVKNMVLDEDILNNIEIEYGIKNPYKDLNNINELIKKTNEDLDTLENKKVQKEENIKELDSNTDNKYIPIQKEMLPVLNKELKEMNKELKEKYNLLEKLKEEKLKNEKYISKSSFKTVLDIINNTSNSIISIKFLKQLLENFPELQKNVFNQYEIMKTTMDSKTIISNLDNIGNNVFDNSNLIDNLIERLKKDVVKVNVKVEFDQPSMRGLRPVNGMSM